MSLSEQRVLAELRQMLLNHELKPGDRVGEAAVAEMFEVSRIPVRFAFRSLEKEGLLKKRDKRGYEVPEIETAAVEDAIEVRGVLEALAAKTLASDGIHDETHKILLDSIQASAAIFKKNFLSEEDVGTYQENNQVFHSTIVQASKNIAVIKAIEQVHSMTSSLGAIIFDRGNRDVEYQRLHFALQQHVVILDAIVSRDAFRAFTLMFEHSNATVKYSDIFHRSAI